MRIAIIGSGVSGLSAAYWLGGEHQVTLFEADRRLGGHVHTVDVDWQGERHAIDTGFIVFNHRTYPRFSELLRELGVRSRPTSMSFSVRREDTGLEYSGASMNGLFAQRRNLLRPKFLRMLRDIWRFNREAPRVLTAGFEPRGAEPTIGDFLRQGRYSSEFADDYLLPMGSAIWSCPMGVFESFPLRFIVEFYHNHGLLGVTNRPTWRVIEGGSRVYVEALLQRFTGRVRSGTPIDRVRRFADRVEVTPRGAAPETFDHVVLACHADQALRLLADPSPVESSVLSCFPYSHSSALLHVDTSLLPRAKRAWASWNYLVTRDGGRDATVTYCMNILQGLRSRHVFSVSLNSDDRVDPAKVLGSYNYEHPIFTTSRAAAQARHVELLNTNRTSYCGAYWRNGFHEDGLVSALAVRDALANPRRAAPAAAASELGGVSSENAAAGVGA